LEIAIREGKKRQIRRIFDTIGHPVIDLKRTAIGPVEIGDLEQGKWRMLSPNEIDALIAIADFTGTMA
jgi:pseudouridine synthase